MASDQETELKHFSLNVLHDNMHALMHVLVRSVFCSVLLSITPDTHLMELHVF